MSDQRLRALERRAKDEDEPRWELARELQRRGLRGPEDPRVGDVVGSWREDTTSKRPLRVRWVESVETRPYSRRVISRTVPGGITVSLQEGHAEHVILRDYCGEGRWSEPVALLLVGWRRWLREAQPLRLLQAREI